MNWLSLFYPRCKRYDLSLNLRRYSSQTSTRVHDKRAPVGEAIPAGASMILKIQGSAIDVVINHQGARDKLINTISKINKEQIGQLLSSIGDEIEKGYTKYTSNPCMISYSSGQGIFVVVSLFVGAGQANGARTFLQTLEKLDIAGQLIGKVFRIGGKLVKAIVNPISKKIKFALAEGVQFAQRIEFKLPNNLYCGIPYLEIKLRDRLKTLTANEIKKLEDDIARQLNDPTIPVDENGNKLLELDIDGEKVPAVVGTNEGLEKIDDGVGLQGAGNLAEYVSSLLNKNIRNAILDLAESKSVAQKYFNRIKQNPNDYISDYTTHLNDFDSWYANVFKSELFEAHHIIPKNVLRDNANLQNILDWARKNGKKWDFGEIENGIMLQKRRKNSLGEIVGDHANHPEYDRQIREKINRIYNESNGNMSDAFDDLDDFVKDLKQQINTEVVNGDKIINTITIP